MLNHKGTQEIKTERLLLRKIRVEDYQDMHRYMIKEEVARYVTWNVHQSPAETKQLCEMWVNQYADGRKYHWAIVLENRVIGNLEIVQLIDTTAFIGWQIDSDYWNMGIMTESGIAVRDYMFGEIGIDKLNAAHIRQNIASGRVMQKIGMKQISAEEYYEKIEKEKHELEVNGMPVDFYSMTMEEWQCLNAK